MQTRLVQIDRTEVVNFARRELVGSLQKAGINMGYDGLKETDRVIYLGVWKSIEEWVEKGQLPKSISNEWMALKRESHVDAWDEDAYIIIPKDHTILLAGKSERAVLYAVYTYLRKEVGMTSIYPGETTIIPPQPITMPKLYKPKFSRRGFVFETINEPEYMIRMIDWMAKNHVSEIFFTFKLWDQLETHVEPEIRKRGMNITLGGHSLKFFMQQDQTNVSPKDHPYHAKKQVDFGNQAWVDDMLAKIVSYCEKIPDLKTISLWPEDVAIQQDLLSEGESFLSVYIHFTEKLKKSLAHLRPDLHVEHIAYNAGLSWEMLERGEVESSDLVDTLVAYWGRDYQKPIIDQKNIHAQRALNSLLDWIKQTTKRDRNITVFEYYSDHFMLSFLFPMLTQRIAKDMVEYKKLGIERILNLVVPFVPKSGEAYSPGDGYNWRWVHGCNSFFFARSSWGESYEDIIEEYMHLFPSQTHHTIRELLFEVEHNVSPLTAWNIALFPARAVDPEKAAFPKQLDILLKQLEKIEGLGSNLRLLEKTHNNPHLSAMLDYLKQLNEGAARIRKDWEIKGGSNSNEV